MARDRPDLSLLTYDLKASGVVRNALRLAGAARAAGLRTELWVARDHGSLRDEVPAGIEVYHSGRKGRAAMPEGPDLASSLWALASYLRERRPAIALSAGNHMNLAANLAYRLAGAPRGVSLWARASNATLATPLEAYLGRPLPRLAGGVVNAVNGLHYRGFERVIAVSRELGETLTGSLGVDSRRLTVIPNGVDVAAVERLAAAPLDDPWFAAGEKPVIVSAGRLSRQKNFADLIRAMAKVRSCTPARLLILGDGPASERRALEGTARALGLQDHFRLAGFDANPYRYMARASLFATSSLWEGASNVVLEALAAGAPVAAYRCPTGIGEVLDPLASEPSVPPHDVDGLAAAIEMRLARPRDGKRLKDYAGGFQLARTLESYVNCFTAALDPARIT